MKEGYAIGLDGTRFPVELGKVYGNHKRVCYEEWEGWVYKCEHSSYDNVYITTPHSGNSSFKDTLYFKGTESNPIRLKSLVLPSGIIELVTDHLTVIDGIIMAEDTTCMDIGGRISINNITDFIGEDVELHIDCR